MATAKRELDTKKLKTTTTKSFYGGVMKQYWNLQYLYNFLADHHAKTSKRCRQFNKLDYRNIKMALTLMLENGKSTEAHLICYRFRISVKPEDLFCDSAPIVANGRPGNGLMKFEQIVSKPHIPKSFTERELRTRVMTQALNDLIIIAINTK